MKAVKIILIVIITLIALGAAAFFLIGFYSPKPGGVRIETNPRASVFINGSLVGETPYQGSYKAGKIILRLVPEGSSQNLVPFETTISLTSGVETVIGRNFGVSESESSNYVISFEKSKNEVAGLVTISQPDNAQVLIDGVSRGFSPYTVSAIAPAMHVVTIKSPGYLDFSMTVRTLVGYRLTFYTKLAKDNGKNQESKTSQKVETKMVNILDTPTGYLRVRSKPGEDGEEIGQADFGESFPYLDTDVATGWIEIQYEAPKPGLPSGITGWISGKYATVSSTLK